MLQTKSEPLTDVCLSVVMMKIASLRGFPNLEEYFTEHNERGRQRGSRTRTEVKSQLLTSSPPSTRPIHHFPPIVLVETPQVGFLGRYHLIHPHSHI